MLKHKLLPKVTDNLLTWDQTFEIANRYHHHPNYQIIPARKYSQHNKPIKNNVTLKDSCILSGMQHSHPTLIQQALETTSLNAINEIKKKEDRELDVTLYFSLFTKANTHGIHRDVTDAYIWQQQGKTKVDVYEDKKYTYVLTPGDIIFIPEGMYHNTTPLTARVSLSFGFFRNNTTGLEHLQDPLYYQKNGIDTSGYINPFV